ncbi:hypothetical protein LOTGIDRAFT_194079 [Lottia gigantea]|uniref:Uncharacterized protein n=1 Tax=Lottia gigantea TaxID=225164 RepID=V4A2W9_LOTGI|nr:hypothetical protein LOTGIDRAFT_194079 [Lottia gigantea]ESO87651.1 hypothetical protein LOTGIDRAFT_194079 [Lottia gigantea]
MYSLPRGPTKINTATRNVRGLPKQRDNLDFYESQHGKKRQDGFHHNHMNKPRPTFNGQKVPNSSNNHIARFTREPVEFESQQHEEICTYFSESWKKVFKECENSKRKDQESGPLWYKEKTPNPKLLNFKPFDLDDWYWQRYLKKVTES